MGSRNLEKVASMRAAWCGPGRRYDPMEKIKAKADEQKQDPHRRDPTTGRLSTDVNNG